VTIADDMFVAPNAVIGADEPGSSIDIGSGSNVQDNVVIHALSHGCIVHGPCRIGERYFIENDMLVLHNATVRGVEIPPGKVVQDGETITKQEDADGLMNITQELAEFKEGVIKINRALVKSYKKHAKDV
jgi:carbonic anhydrase/acetyltransferase-like protein (isoleucine patch superfamily)